MTCASCSNTVTDLVSQLPGVSHVVVNLLGHSGTLNVESQDLVRKVVETIEDAGYEAEVVSVEPIHVLQPPSHLRPARSSEGPYHAVFSVGGMTCASCSNTITELVSQLPGVTDVVVNVLGKSASATIEQRKFADTIVETIEDAGYEAEVVAVEAISSETGELEQSGPRQISLRVNGMFCKHYPIIQLSYHPNPPEFTIRTIISAIASSKSPPFEVSIYRPPSLEERARRMQLHEQRQMLLRLLFSVVVAIPTFIIAIVYMSLVPHQNRTRRYFMEPIWTGNVSRVEWALFFLATPVMFYSAGVFHRRSLKEIKALWRPGSRTPIWRRFVRFGSMNLLVSTGVSVAYFASIALLGLAAAQSPSPTGDGDTTTYLDSVVFLTMFLLAGRFMEAHSKTRTADAVTALGKLRPAEALLLMPSSQTANDQTRISQDSDLEKGDEKIENGRKRGWAVQRTDVSLLEAGDIVRVPSGSTPPADGTLVAGSDCTFDESSLTGESRLVKKEIGDKVFLGTINKGNMVDIRVDSIGGESMLDHVVKIVREGQTRRAPIERIADLITGYFVPVVTLLAVLTWIIWLVLGESGSLPADYLDIEVGGWVVWSLEFAIAVFVVACPCGIGLAAPTALLVGSGLAAKFGILARGGGEAFQEAAQLDLIVFDKTGTLTEGGEPRVTDAKVIADRTKWKPDIILGMAAEIESASSHPLASALKNYCEDNAASTTMGSQFEEVAGKGLKASFQEYRCSAIIGNESWMAEHGAIIPEEIVVLMNGWKSDAKSVILLAVLDEENEPKEDRHYIVVAAFAVADHIRGEASEVISRLQRQGISTWMISGDNVTTAKAVARLVGISEENVIAGVLPHQKQVGPKRPSSNFGGLAGRRTMNDRCIVAMVGDGINDAPALSVADVGIAIGSGSDVAVTSASFILVTSNLRSLLTLTDLSRKVFTRVKFNFLWAVMYNLIALPIAAGVVYPAGHARLSPVWASLAMALS
ncbi:heavy metal translocatin [Gloeophyllum trabeum ATCC 11539]|uniref:Heavy metal translocatin n=1 Tax=Gloeophyllum trabeum (strain ATCC 11539 / FP-39264 / Madison 617) TaxID=670483 RepID=S7QHE0_GLOTA|nr:heavy metal translocatin [Gloeophyllum trabeum ATCC 11539]EPQ59221.1 heavy metal translocatin [Gloeophyllum trabeum ATCC 11539]